MIQMNFESVKLFLANKTLVLLLIFASIALRWNSIRYPSTIDWDENTFLVVASESAKGNFPYTTTFENKSPLSMLPQTLLMIIGVNDLRFFRIVAAILLGLAAYALALAQQDLHKVGKFLVGILFIYLFSSISSGLAWISELNIILLFASVFYLVLNSKWNSSYQAIRIGFLIGLIPLTRANWSFVALVLFGYTLIRLPTWRQRLRFITATIAPSFLIFLLYLFNGNLKNLLQGFVLLPMAITKQFQNYQFPIDSVLISLVIFLLIILTKLNKTKTQDLSMLSWLSIAIILSLFFSAPDYSHHLTQLSPMLALSFGAFLRSFSKSALRQISVGVVLLFMIVISIQSMSSMRISLSNLEVPDAKKRMMRELSLVSEVRALGLPKSTTFMALDEHYLYWRLGFLPPEPLLTHPALFFVDSAFYVFYPKETKVNGVDHIFKVKPRIVVESGLRWMDEINRNRTYEYLKDSYVVEKSVSNSPQINVWVLKQ